VALKILPEVFADDPELRQSFEREARTSHQLSIAATLLFSRCRKLKRKDAEAQGLQRANAFRNLRESFSLRPCALAFLGIGRQNSYAATYPSVLTSFARATF
jgi:hypothetical protein